MITPIGKYDLKLLKALHDSCLKKSDIIEKSDNILIKYMKSPKIIRDSENDNASLNLFIDELLRQIDNNNFIILPFIQPMKDLIDIYMNTKDNNIKKEKWENIFIKLIENSFFDKEYLIPIYSYFTELYSVAENIQLSDEKIGKFKKVVDLWKLIYLNTQSKIKTNNSNSSFCLLGSGLIMSFSSPVPLIFV